MRASTWPSLSALEHGAFVFAGLLVYVLVTRVSQQRRHPSAAMAWVLAIAAFPYLALPLFLAFGTRKITRPRSTAVPGLLPTVVGAPDWATRLLSGLGLSGPVHNHAVDFHANGPQSYQALIGLIDGARQTLEVGTYLLRDDRTGDAVATQLCAAAARGVRVRLLLDALGSLTVSRRLMRRLRSGGVEVRRFMPLWDNPMRGRTNLRNHRKIAVADARRLWSGGRNLADEYFFDSATSPAWIDLSFVLEGPVAVQARVQFERDWLAASGKVSGPAGPGSEGSAGEGVVLAQWVPTGPDHADDTVHALLVAAAYQARERILAVTPYFVPDEALLDAWCMACRRGVRVSLVVPEQSNHRLADWARERALRRLHEAGAQVLLSGGMVHAKLVVVDGDLALCGSVNLDGRSLFLNYEAMTAFYGGAEIDGLSRWHARQAEAAGVYSGARPAWWRDVAEGMVRAVGFQL